MAANVNARERAVTERAAKLTVKVKLHAAQPQVLPKNAPPARLSKLKVTCGLLLLCLCTATGYWVWQQWLGQAPHRAVEHSEPADMAAAANLEPGMSVDAGDLESALPDKRQPQRVSSPEERQIEALTTETQAPASLLLTDKPQTAETIAATAAALEETLPQPAQRATAISDAAAGQSSSASRAWPEGFSRIVLAATMERLEPGAAIDALVAQQQIQRLYLFTELKGYAGQQLVHRWSYAGKIQTEALLTIEDSPWRTYSEKWLLPDQLGEWRVEIIDQQQNVLYQHDFLYQ